jgi:hypothetical protein
MTRTLPAAAAAALLLAAPAAAAPMQFATPLTHDVIVNHNGAFDSAATPMEASTNRSYGTQTAVENAGAGDCAASPTGLPDDAFFPATTEHPAVQLSTQNDNAGNNAHQFEASGDSIVVDVPDGRYAALHTFAVYTGLGGRMRVDITYADGSKGVQALEVPQWTSSPLPPSYRLVSSLDRMSADGSSCQNVSNGAGGIFGTPFKLDATKTTTSFEFTRTDFDDPPDPRTRLNLFGALVVPGHALTVAKGGGGQGTVKSNPAGIDCGADCSEGYQEEAVVHLTAAPDAGSRFAGWSGDCSGAGGCDVTMSAARNVTATFEREAPTGTPPPSEQTPPPPPPPQQTPPATTPGQRRAAFATLASARRRCRTRRLRLRLKDVAGEELRSAGITIGGRTRTVTGAALDDPITLRAPRGRFTVRIEITTADGDVIRASRTFRRCEKRRASRS